MEGFELGFSPIEEQSGGFAHEKGRPRRAALHRVTGSYASCASVGFCRRRMERPMPTKPSSISAQVAGSGTAPIARLSISNAFWVEVNLRYPILAGAEPEKLNVTSGLVAGSVLLPVAGLKMSLPTIVNSTFCELSRMSSVL